MVEDWEVSRTTGRCAASDRPLAEGEAYYAVLLETTSGFERRDYAIDAWQGPPEGTFCYWRGRVPVREKKPCSYAVDMAILSQLFTQLEDAQSESKQQLRFVLALLLMRKRLLKMDRSTTEEGREYWHMRMTSDQTVHRVLNPRLEKEQIDRLSAQLTAILSGEVDALQVVEEPDAEPSPAGGEESRSCGAVETDAQST
ncbi:MAG: hypothetical protein ACUVXJ_11285 [Phycisphaerae bacterium]